MTRVFCRCQSNEPQTTVPYTRRWKSGSVRVSSRVPDTERCTRARSSNCHSERGIRSIAQRISLAPDPSDSPLFALCDDLRRRGPSGAPGIQVDPGRLGAPEEGRRPGVRVPVGRPERRRTASKSAAESALAGGHGARVGAPARHGHGTRQHHVGREGPPDALARVRRDHAMCPHCLVGSAGRRAAAAVSADLYAGPVIFSERPGRQAAERQARG